MFHLTLLFALLSVYTVGLSSIKAKYTAKISNLNVKQSVTYGNRHLHKFKPCKDLNYNKNTLNNNILNFFLVLCGVRY